ncbi:MAG: WD40 repeat domain-containing protein [Candidatus Poribacteria bacterium]|nr:WD40 repeat domain-containing protein [Candidatus Poribacteria bacterium]
MERTELFQNCIQSELPPGLKSRLGKKQVTDLTFSPDGTRLAAGGDGRIWIYDVESGAQFAMLSGYTENIRALAFAPNNTLLASGSEDNTLRLWDTATAREVLTLAGDSNLVQALAVSSPDGVPLPSWDPRTERLLATSNENPGRVRSLAFSPDGTTLASGSADGRIRLWEVETGAMLTSLSVHDGLVLALAFSPNGEVLASGGSDTLVRLWDLDSHRLLATLRAHTDSISALAFSNDGEILASGGRDRYLQLWDAHTKELLSTFPVQEGVIRELTFSPDGGKLMCATREGFLLIRE